VNPDTGKPYSQGLPECRAYEVVVSTQEKGLYDVEPLDTKGVLVAPSGDAVGFQSISAFAGVENVLTGNTGQLVEYISRRTGSGWAAEGVYPPPSLIDNPVLPLPGFSAELSPTGLSCGPARIESSPSVGFRCALGHQGGSWDATPIYPHVGGTPAAPTNNVWGGSADLSRAIIQAGSFLPADTVAGGSGGLYEIAGVGTASPQLRLVNLDNNGNQLTNPENPTTRYAPVFGDSGLHHTGSAYHAFSDDGETVFFTATPTAAQQPAGEQQTIFARVHHSETVSVSNPVPIECTTCSPTPRPATYMGASADGSKVFFTTAQQLVNGDKDETNDLYMYDFTNPPTHHLIQLSSGGLGDVTPGEGANVQGVVRSSSDGTHVYFVATGVLTSFSNSLDQFPQAGADNLYGVDTNTGETKFVATLSESDAELWGESDGPPVGHDAQTTPDGRYLVFNTFAHLAAEDTNEAQAAYRYAFQTGELTWLSHPAPGFTALNQGKNTVITPLPSDEFGGNQDINDWSRAITGNGEDVIFWTSEQLQANDVNGAGDVYLWHNGTVSLISDGRDPLGTATLITSTPTSTPSDGISESGSDIFFFTHTQLVGQHTDVYQTLYDARIGGGFPGPKPTPSCASEEWTCQGHGSEPSGQTNAEGSATQQPGGNLIAAPFKEILEPEPKRRSKPLTNAQKLKAALAKCRKLKSGKRRSCEATARKKYTAKPKPQSKKK
jgi:hypothetical protein